MNKKNKVIFFLFLMLFIFFIINIIVVYAVEDFTKAQELIKNRIPCSQLTNKQLELLGDYYMEQMHPNELHEIMDQRMGGEGSAQLRNVHIAMGKSFYCADNSMMSMGMMNMMVNRNGMINYSQESYGDNYLLVLIILYLIIVILIVLMIILIKQMKRSKKKK